MRGAVVGRDPGPFPGWLTVVLTDASGQEHVIREKVPVLTRVDLDDRTLPYELWLDGTVEHAVNLGIEERVPLAAMVAEALGGEVPVQVENDLNVAVVGSAHALGPQVHDIGFLALGTGVAAGLLLDGRLRRGSRGAAGEIGHLTLVPGGLPCKCGQLGCLEQYASGSALDTAWPSRLGLPAPG